MSSTSLIVMKWHMRRPLPATVRGLPVGRALRRPSNANVLNFQKGFGGVLVGVRVLLQHLFLQYSCSTVVVRNLVLWQHHGSFYGSTLAALYQVQYCCSTAPCAIAAPWCYCSTLVLLQHRKGKKRGRRTKRKSKKGKNLNLVEMAKLRTKRRIPDPRVPGKAPRQELIVVHPVFASGSSGFRSKNYLLFIYEVLSIYLSIYLSMCLDVWYFRNVLDSKFYNIQFLKMLLFFVPAKVL